MSKTLYGFSAANAGELPAWFNSKRAALQFALQCGWDNVQLETADADDVDPSDILDKRSPTKRRSPTKAEELDALQQFIDSFHDDSYLKGWLSQVYAEVERNIRSDIYPTVSLAETDAECRKRLADCDAVIEQRKINAQRIIDADRAAAQRQHAAIIAEAEKVALKLRDEAARKRAEVRNTLHGLRSLLDSLEE